MIAIFGYIAAVFIGITLGLTGGGGSILTMPVLVYLLGVSPVLATAYSLFIVGFSSIFGVIGYFKKQLVDFKIALIFGGPSIVGIILSRKFILPILPENITEFLGIIITKDLLIMVVFAILMIGASYAMIKGRKPSKKSEEATKINYFRMSLQGLIVGTITGFVGAGGGFLIVPALVLLAALPIKKAVGTSLMIITVNSSIGFLSGITNFEIAWVFLVSFSILAAFGIFLGTWLSKFVSGERLKPAFGVFILIMGIYILGKELLPS